MIRALLSICQGLSRYTALPNGLPIGSQMTGHRNTLTRVGFLLV
jgi:hypothetical protein